MNDYSDNTITPDCSSPDGHDWASPYDILGGIEENPGVWGHGGSVILREVCSHCGWYRELNTDAQDQATGEQGLRVTTYLPPDRTSLNWCDLPKREDVDAVCHDEAYDDD